MKAKELIAILKKSPEKEVLISSDEEGNSFHNINEKTISTARSCIVIYPHEEVKINE